MLDSVDVYAPFRPLPWQLAPWRDKSFVLLLTGSAGGGKSRFAMEKLHAFCKKYDGATALMVRKTRESMTNSTVLQFCTEVVGHDPDVEHIESKHRFEYRNGSILAYGGMKDEYQREQVRGIGQRGGLDICWMEEANKFSEADYQELIGRMRGRAAPWRQLILTTNPDGPSHWINMRLIIAREAHVYYSRAVDNPANPPEYLESLKLLTGIQKDRLVDGKWTQAEGQVYDNFDPDRNVTELSERVADHDLLWACDDGYSAGDGPGTLSYHPRVILFAQYDGRGGVNVFDERYATGEASYDTTIDAALAMHGLPLIAYVDSSAAMLRGALTVRSVPNTGATHPVLEGIKNVRKLLCDANGVSLIRIHPRCKNLISEFVSYRYDDSVSGGDRKPMKMNDHGLDCLRYLCWHLRYGI